MFGYKKFRDYEARSVDVLNEMFDNNEWETPESTEESDEPYANKIEKDPDSMDLFVDLDGVIRNTIDVLKEDPSSHKEWDWGPECQKQFDDNLEDSLFVFPSVNETLLKEILMTLMVYPSVNVTFLTCQPKEQQKKFTDLFVCHTIDRMVEKHQELRKLDLSRVSVGFVDKSEDKLFWLLKNPHAILIDDYPLFPDKIQSHSFDKKLMDRIFLFKQPWNESKIQEHRYVVSSTSDFFTTAYTVQDTQFVPRKAIFDCDFVWRFLRKLNQD